MNIFLKTLNESKKSMFFWMLGVFLTVLMYASLYPMVSQSDELVKAFENVPPAVQAIVGDLEEIGTPEGYMSSEYLNMTLPLILTILAIATGSGLINKEEETGTIELLLSSPISRTQIYLEKALALIIIITLVGLSGWIGMAVGQLLVEIDLNMWNFLMATKAAISLAAVLGILSLTITTFTSKKGISIAITSLIFFGSFLLQTFARMIKEVEPYEKLSLFYYYNGAEVLKSGIDYFNLFMLAALVIVLAVTGIIAFNKRDIGV